MSAATAMAESLIDRIKAEVSLRELAERSGVVWDMKRSRPARGDWWAPCPFHAERSASFHVVEGGGGADWFKCFGCGLKGSVIDFVMLRDGLTVAGAIRALAQRTQEPVQVRRPAPVPDRGEARAAWCLGQARRIWAEAEAAHPLLEAYLEARGVRLAAIGGVPRALRLHPALEYWARGQVPGRDRPAHVGPAMVAAIGRVRLGEVRMPFKGVHRTWITAEGRARSGDGVKIPKMMLGKTGEIFGEPVVLSRRPRKKRALSCAAPSAEADDAHDAEGTAEDIEADSVTPAPLAVVVGEGIETTLAGWSGLIRAGLSGWSAEAALSLGALAGPGDPRGCGPGLAPTGAPFPSPLPDLRSADRHWLPAEGVRAVLILGEGSSRDPESARRMGERTLAKLTARDFDARLIVPGGDWSRDRDFADIAREDLLS